MAKFTPNPTGIRKVGLSTQITEDLERRGERVKAAAEASAPVDSGRYRDSFEVFPLKLGNGGVRVVSRDFKAWILEKGSAPHGKHPGTPAHHTLTKALDSARGEGKV